MIYEEIPIEDVNQPLGYFDSTALDILYDYEYLYFANDMEFTNHQVQIEENISTLTEAVKDLVEGQPYYINDADYDYRPRRLEVFSCEEFFPEKQYILRLLIHEDFAVFYGEDFDGSVRIDIEETKAQQVYDLYINYMYEK